jgi:hypothetical protein
MTSIPYSKGNSALSLIQFFISLRTVLYKAIGGDQNGSRPDDSIITSIT